MVISDLVTSKEVDPESANSDKWCSCIDGALTKEHYLDSIRKAGFSDIEVLEEKLYMDGGDNIEGRQNYQFGNKGSKDLKERRIRSMKFSFGAVRVNLKKSKQFFLYASRMQDVVRWLRAFLESMLPEDYEPLSAGTKPTSEVNPLAIRSNEGSRNRH